MFRSVNSIVIAPAKTGKEITNKIVVKTTLQTKSVIRSKDNNGDRILYAVEIKLILPKIDEAPAKCKLKIAKSTLFPLWDKTLERGGYTVQPVPTPISIKDDINNKIRDGGNNQKDRLFIRGNDISGAPDIIGKNQLPKPPINTGITIKKIIRKAWAVTITL